MGIQSTVEGPATKSVNSVFDTINKKTEALDILKKYKNANIELVRASVENIQILGMSEPVKLADIYSITRISTTIHRRLYGTQWAKLKSKESISHNRIPKTTLNADHYMENHDRVVILAGPGSGKTTLLKYTALTFIDNKLFLKSSFKIKKIPFYISLPNLASSELPIEQFMAEKIKIKTHEYAEQYVNRLLSKGKAIVLLDSLDEVSLASRERVYELIDQFSKLYPKAKMIITCRVADYSRTLEGFYEVEIVRLSENAIKKIIRAWFKGKPQKAKELIRHLSVDKDVFSLTETPLLLSLLCIQYSNDLNIPNRKVELYSRCIEALLRLWDTSRGFRRDTAFSSLTDDRKEKLFSEIAFNFLCEGEIKYIFPEPELLKLISKFIERFGLPQNSTSKILNEIECHHGILEKHNAETYAFSHLSFQEYFIASAIVAKHLELTFARKNVSNSRASSVIIFMVALMDDPSTILNFLMEKSKLKGIKTYPAMNSRTEVLSLLYRCMNSGVAIELELRNRIYEHIATSQIEISSVYRDAKTYPIARLEDDGVSHTFFYAEKTRKTLAGASISYKKLANEILLSPNEAYAEIAIRVIDSLADYSSDIVNLSVKG